MHNWTVLSKVTIHPTSFHEGADGELKYTATPSLTSGLVRGGWSRSRTRRFTPGNNWQPFCRKLCGSQGQSGKVRKISPSLKLDPRTAQPVGSHYIDCAILAHKRAPRIHVPVSRFTSSTKIVHRPKKRVQHFHMKRCVDSVVPYNNSVVPYNNSCEIKDCDTRN
jgi:hypothetical protein